MTMEFLEALAKAKEAGVSPEDFKTHWDEQLERQRVDKAQEREERIKEREYNLAKLEREKELAEAKAKVQDVGVKHEVGTVRGPKIPCFIDSREDLDSYLKRFERLAKANGWQEDTWADKLGALLTGKALDVYTGLGDDEGKDYETLKRVLFQKYMLTAESYRKRFREAKTDNEETYTQLAVRLRRYFDRWVQLSKIDMSVEGLIDIFVREQMLRVVEPRLAVHLRERNPKSIDDMVQMADLYQEAHRFEGKSKIDKRNGDAEKGGKYHQQGNNEGGTARGCYKCGSREHFAKHCKGRERVALATGTDTQPLRERGCFLCKSTKHWKRQCPLYKERVASATTLDCANGDAVDGQRSVTGHRTGDDSAVDQVQQ